MRVCTVDKCTNKHEARGFCCKHYERWKKYGDVEKIGSKLLKLPFFLEGLCTDIEWRSLKPYVRQRIIKSGTFVDQRSTRTTRTKKPPPENIFSDDYYSLPHANRSYIRKYTNLQDKRFKYQKRIRLKPIVPYSFEDKKYINWLQMIKWKYKLSEDKYWDLFYDQNAVCRICKKYQIKRLQVDHNHSCCKGETSCGKCIRGLLCNPCNNMLGCAKDNLATLKNAQKYLKIGVKV